MLRTNHQEVIYPTPSFSEMWIGEKSFIPKILFNFLESFNRASINEQKLVISDSKKIPADKILEIVESKRATLARRVMLREKLSKKEKIELETLNLIVEGSLVKPKSEAPEVIQAVTEAKLLLSRLKNG